MKRHTHYDLSGRTAIITGGAGGFGIAIAQRLLAAGAQVALWDIDASLLRTAAASLQGKLLHQVVDICDSNHVAQACREVHTQFGSIDILINNAGILGAVANTWEVSVEEFRRVLDTNLTGAFICSKAVVPYLLANPEQSYNRGRIVNVSSIQAKEGMPQAAAYAASKAGLIALTKTLGKELAPTGILVNAITPAAVMTAMSDGITETRKQQILDRIPMQRFLLSEEVADQVIWLCSDDCSFATGAIFDLSGGRATY
jgi:NAD(P)-dependent dehydrogenase (short-subunit alcohol dehydrogenase family)